MKTRTTFRAHGCKLPANFSGVILLDRCERQDLDALDYIGAIVEWTLTLVDETDERSELEPRGRPASTVRLFFDDQLPWEYASAAHNICAIPVWRMSVHSTYRDLNDYTTPSEMAIESIGTSNVRWRQCLSYGCPTTTSKRRCAEPRTAPVHLHDPEVNTRNNGTDCPKHRVS